VTRTLYLYLGGALVRVALLAAVVLTVLMSVLAVIEPLRSQGMSGPQALRIFSFSLPVMFSFTLPVAALFAATFVYGRFSQDNELMAAKASGLATASLLRPALYVGLVVSVATLALSFWVAPRMWKFAKRTVKNDLKQVAYHRLTTQRYFRVPGRPLIFHADRVDEESGWVGGVVMVDFSDRANARVVVAPAARPQVDTSGDEAEIRLNLVRPLAFEQTGMQEARTEDPLLMETVRVSTHFVDRPMFYDWGLLWETWRDPMASPIVADDLRRIQQALCAHAFLEHFTGTIRDDGEYRGLIEFVPARARPTTRRGAQPSPLRSVDILAAGAELTGAGQAVLTGPAEAGGEPGPVVVYVKEGGAIVKHFHARRARLRVDPDAYKDELVARLILDDARGPGLPVAIGAAHADYQMGPFAVPDHIIARAEGANVNRLVRIVDEAADYSAPILDAEGETIPPVVVALIRGPGQHSLSRTREALAREVLAELHWRPAYAVGCFLMVVIGAALGVIFRGGQALTAFALAAIPASLVIILLLMGKELIANPGAPAMLGIGAIWGGIGAMGLGAVYLHAVPMRR
jgi:lipopolysaccharide export LptBFGC system permease protein LptF